jgi:adhesin transport system outer membrane protein
LGASSSADVVRAESRVAEALEILASSLQSLSQAQANYRQYYDNEAEPYILPKEISIEDLDLNKLDVYVRGHPAALAAQLDLDAANFDVDAAKARLFGGIYAEASRSKSQGPGSVLFNESNSFNVVVRAELYSGGSQSARLEQTLAKLDKASMELNRVKQEQLRILREAFAEYNGQLASVSARMLVFKGAEDSYAISKDLYAFSRSSLFEVLKSQEDLYNSGQRLIDGIINRALAKYKLLHAAQRLNQEIISKN